MDPIFRWLTDELSSHALWNARRSNRETTHLLCMLVDSIIFLHWPCSCSDICVLAFGLTALHSGCWICKYHRPWYANLTGSMDRLLTLYRCWGHWWYRYTCRTWRVLWRVQYGPQREAILRTWCKSSDHVSARTCSRTCYWGTVVRPLGLEV